MVESQKSQSTGGDTRNRRNVLVTVSLAMTTSALTRHLLADLVTHAKAERTTDQKRNRYFQRGPLFHCRKETHARAAADVEVEYGGSSFHSAQ